MHMLSTPHDLSLTIHSPCLPLNRQASSSVLSAQHRAHVLQAASQAAPAPAGPGPAPGEPTSLGQKLLNTATATLQSFKPVNKICQHVCTFHCYAQDTTRQVRLMANMYQLTPSLIPVNAAGCPGCILRLHGVFMQLQLSKDPEQQCNQCSLVVAVAAAAPHDSLVETLNCRCKTMVCISKGPQLVDAVCAAPNRSGLTTSAPM